MKTVKTYLEMIKFEHTIFALPFAFMGAMLGSVVVNGTLPSWAQVGWVTLAMVGARSAAMGLNRLIDRHIDGKNPRTEDRAIPAGKLSVMEVSVFIVVSFVLLFVAASQLSTLAMQLLPIAVFMLVFYSYTKRFTWLCHVALGLTIGLAPLGGWVAVTGKIDGIALIFYAAVALWIAGFDVIYACQDHEFDREEKVYSIPGRFGLTKALQVAKVLHVFTAAGLFSLIFLTDLGGWYAIGMLIASLVLIYEHTLVSPNDLSKLNAAFFTMNGILSCVVFVFACIDLVVKI